MSFISLFKISVLSQFSNDFVFIDGITIPFSEGKIRTLVWPVHGSVKTFKVKINNHLIFKCLFKTEANFCHIQAY